ncbi:MAG: BatA domain-containing protein, partial [Planctomycetota bacterium]|nr:BatA domain-containing protein [Planctomycetota bacterium]
MTFVTIGLAIAGAASVIVPILIHLLSRQRRRPVRWGAMRFLIEALRKHRRRLQLEQLLLLAVRCLILLVLGAALARPSLDAAGIFETGGSRAVFIVIDNGLASGVRLDSAGEVARTALDRSVEQAIDLIKSLGPGDVVGVVTAARPANGMVIPPSSDHAAIIDLLRSIEPAEAPTDLAAALPLLRSALDELEPQRESPVVYLLSDLRRGSVPLDRSLPSVPVDVGSATMLLAAPAAQTIAPNVQVASIKPMRGLILSPGYEGSGQVTVRLSRSGG